MSMNNDYRMRHTAALLMPNIPEEQTISNLYHELTVLADRYERDAVMLPAVQHIGSAILALLNDDVGRLDISTMSKQVEDTIRRAGGDWNAV